MELVPTRGKIGLEAGFLLSRIGPNSTDDPARIEALRKAVTKILKITP